MAWNGYEPLSDDEVVEWLASDGNAWSERNAVFRALATIHEMRSRCCETCRHEKGVRCTTQNLDEENCPPSEFSCTGWESKRPSWER